MGPPSTPTASRAPVLTALLSALGWSALDLVRKRLVVHLADLPLAAWLNAGMLPLIAGWAWASGAGWPDAAYLGPWCVAVSITAGAQVLFLTAIRTSDFSVVVPMLSLTPVISSAIAVVTLGEAPSLRQAACIAAIVAGCLSLAVQRVDGRLSLDVGAAMMAGVAVLWSASGVVDKWALRHADPPMHGLLATCGELTILLTLIVARGQTAQLVVPPAARWTLVAGFFALGTGFLLQLYALQTLLVGVVEGIKRAVGTALAPILGLALGEEVPLSRVGSLLVVVAGVVALTLV